MSIKERPFREIYRGALPKQCQALARSFELPFSLTSSSPSETDYLPFNMPIYDDAGIEYSTCDRPAAGFRYSTFGHEGSALHRMVSSHFEGSIYQAKVDARSRVEGGPLLPGEDAYLMEFRRAHEVSRAAQSVEADNKKLVVIARLATGIDGAIEDGCDQVFRTYHDDGTIIWEDNLTVLTFEPSVPGDPSWGYQDASEKWADTWTAAAHYSATKGELKNRNGFTGRPSPSAYCFGMILPKEEMRHWLEPNVKKDFVQRVTASVNKHFPPTPSADASTSSSSDWTTVPEA